MGNVFSDSDFAEGLWNEFDDSNSVPVWIKQWSGGSSSYIDRVGLAREMVELILDKLLESIDYIRFAAVCKEWYHLAKRSISKIQSVGIIAYVLPCSCFLVLLLNPQQERQWE